MTLFLFGVGWGLFVAACREVTVCEMGSVGGRQDGWEADRSPACCGGVAVADGWEQT